MPLPIAGTVSGSSSSVILGLNEWSTPLEKWQTLMEQIEPGFNEKNGYELPVFDGNAATRYGHAFEKSNISITSEKLCLQIGDEEKVFQKTVNGVPLSAHVDGIIEGNVLYEGKTTSVMAFRNKWTEERIPRSYFCQVQHSLYLTGFQSAVVAVLVFPEAPETWEKMGWETFKGSNGEYFLIQGETNEPPVNPIEWARPLAQMGYHHIYHIERDDELIEKMLGKYREWWTLYIEGRKPPAPMNVDDIKRMVPQPVGTIVVEDTTMLDAIQEYKEIGKEVGKSGNLEKRRAQLKTMFLDRALTMQAVEDEESCDKWIFRDGQGRKLVSWGKNAKGSWVFR